MPDVPIVFLSLSPAPSRWNERDENKKLNDLILADTKSQPNLKFIDTYDMTLTADGKAREELFVSDRLHFNEAVLQAPRRTRANRCLQSRHDMRLPTSLFGIQGT
jgi:hypothetical protein